VFDTEDQMDEATSQEGPASERIRESEAFAKVDQQCNREPSMRFYLDERLRFVAVASTIR
jgi:hypothetical protein